jgi:hypothetical protein
MTSTPNGSISNLRLRENDSSAALLIEYSELNAKGTLELAELTLITRLSGAAAMSMRVNALVTARWPKRLTRKKFSVISVEMSNNGRYHDTPLVVETKGISRVFCSRRVRGLLTHC